MAVKVFFYTLRPYDEQGILEDLAKQRGIEYGYTEAYPTMENAQLAAGYDAVSLTPCDMSAPMLQRFHDLGVKAICCRSIGYDHVDLEKARELGMKVSNVDYPPNGVANFAIMLMLMSLRKAGHILKRGELQDYSLKGKIGRDISNCTVGVIGTGRIGQTVLKHLSGFGCELLAYDLYQNDEVKKIAKYVPLETLIAESDVITLHTNATEENHHLLNADAFAKMDGCEVVYTGTYNTNETDFNAILTAAKAADPDVLFIPSSITTAGIIIKQARDMGITARIMAGDTWENATIMENAGVENCEGVALSTFFDENDTDASEFVQGFKAYLNGDAEALKLNGNNDTVAAVSALGYDAYMAIIEALKNVSGDITGEAVRDALASVSFDGVTGSISFDENGDANKDMAYIKIMSDGAFKFVGTQKTDGTFTPAA